MASLWVKILMLVMIIPSSTALIFITAVERQQYFQSFMWLLVLLFALYCGFKEFVLKKS